MTNNTIAVIADKNVALVFQSIGAQVFPDTNIEETVKDLAKRKFTIILIPEKQFEENKEFLDSYKSQSYPIILPIPDGINKTGFGMERLNDNMVKALGGINDSVKRGTK